MSSRIYLSQINFTLFTVFRKPTYTSTINIDRSNKLHCYRNGYHSELLWGRRGFQTSQRLDGTHRVNMPSLSPTMTKGTIVQWLKKEGDPIAAGDVLCEIQTDKAVVSMEYDDDGILAKILVPEKIEDVKVGTLIALAVDEGDDWKNVEVPADAGAHPPEAVESSVKTAAANGKPTSATMTTSTGSQPNGHLLGPAAKNYIAKYGLNSSNIPASGPHGTITKGSSEHAPPSIGKSSKQSTKAKGQPGPATYTDIEISNMRRTIAKRLHQSKSTIPHAYGIAECKVNKLMEFRKSLTAVGMKVSVNDLVVKCVANALAVNLAVNFIWEKSQLKQLSAVDISVAVATPNGLITPIVTDVGGRDILSISTAVRELAAKARDGKLKPHEFMGGSFSISNLGMFGIHSFSAIINPPQCAILAVGGTNTQIDENGKALLTVNTMLSYDASAIMEDEAMNFLAALKTEVENINDISMGIFNLKANKNNLE